MTLNTQINNESVYLVKLAIVGWIDVFTNKSYVSIAIDNLIYCQQNKGLILYAFVLMPGYISLIVKDREKQLNKLLGRYKSYTAKQILAVIADDPHELRKDWMLHVFRFHAKYKSNYEEYHFWQSDNHSTVLTNQEELLKMVNYIHDDPVRSGFVTKAADWLYSSANPATILHVLPYAQQNAVK